MVWCVDRTSFTHLHRCIRHCPDYFQIVHKTKGLWRLTKHKLHSRMYILYAGRHTSQQTHRTNSSWSNVTPAKTDTNSLSLLITSRSMPLSTCDAHVFSKCGFTQMKIMSHFVTTTPLSSVIFAPSTRHFSKFTKFGPDTTTCVGFMIPIRGGVNA